MPGATSSVRKSWAERHQKADKRVGRQVSGAGSNISGGGSISIESQSIDGLIELIESSPGSDVDQSYSQRVIRLASQDDGIVRQKGVLVACMRRLLCGKEPKEQQVRSLRCLGFG